MPIAMSGVDYKSAPESYAELFRIYYLYVVNLVHKCGIDDINKEDVASEILTRFYERDFLEKFDPTLTFSYRGTVHPARFRSFLSKFVITYVRGHLDKQKRIKNREIQIFDLPVGNTESHAAQITWGEQYGPTEQDHQDDVLDLVAYEDLVQGLRNFLADIPRRSNSDRCDLVALFDALVSQVRDRGCYDIEALSRQFHVSHTAMHQWVWWLRANIAEALGLPLPPKRRRTARTAQPS